MAAKPRIFASTPHGKVVNPILRELREKKRDVYDLLMDLDSMWADQFSDAQVWHAREVLSLLGSLRTVKGAS
jgi:hypothetical protein